MSGKDVREVQVRVAGWAALDEVIAIDRQFGPATERALIRYQTAYGLTANGVADSQTFASFDALATSDGSTKNFMWSEFHSPDVEGFTGSDKASRYRAEINVRHLMYRLEALRVKLGNQPIRINSGFRSTADNAAAGGVTDSQHLYGTAADIGVASHSVSEVIEMARTCSFLGIIRYPGHTHVDIGYWFRDFAMPVSGLQSAAHRC